MCPWGGRREGPEEPPAPGPGLPEHGPSRFSSPAQPAAAEYVLLVTHPPSLLSVCRLGKGAGRGRGEGAQHWRYALTQRP